MKTLNYSQVLEVDLPKYLLLSTKIKKKHHKELYITKQIVLHIEIYEYASIKMFNRHFMFNDLIECR